MLLVSGDALLQRMSVQAGPGVMAAAEAALRSITPVLESVLDTVFAFSTRTDIFDVSVRGTRRFSLSQGFVVADEPIEVRVARPDEVLTAAGQGVVLSPAKYTLDTEKGEVKLLDGAVPGRLTLSVGYSAGFEEQDQVYEEVPAWLQEAALVLASRSMNAYLLSHRRVDVRDVSAELHRLSTTLINSHFRSRVGVAFPSSIILQE